MEETRSEIIKRIETKKGSADKLVSKATNLKTQRETYLAAIEEYKEKIVKLEALVAQRDENTNGYEDDASVRTGEVEHMEEILDRFDKAVAEKAKLDTKIQDTVDNAPINILPNGFPKVDDSYKNDPKFKKMNARRDYLMTVIEGALPDIKKIFYSRGIVSEINAKGRKDV